MAWLQNKENERINPATEDSEYAIQELLSRLVSLAATKQSGLEALRVILVNAAGAISTLTTVTTVTAVTTVGTITNFGTGIPAKEHADDMNNLLVTMANISNVVIT